MTRISLVIITETPVSSKYYVFVTWRDPCVRKIKPDITVASSQQTFSSIDIFILCNFQGVWIHPSSLSGQNQRSFLLLRGPQKIDRQQSFHLNVIKTVPVQAWGSFLCSKILHISSRTLTVTIVALLTINNTEVEFRGGHREFFSLTCSSYLSFSCCERRRESDVGRSTVNCPS